MREDNSKNYSDEELDRILAEYSTIGRSRQNQTPAAGQQGASKNAQTPSQNNYANSNRTANVGYNRAQSARPQQNAAQRNNGTGYNRAASNAAGGSAYRNNTANTSANSVYKRGTTGDELTYSHINSGRNTNNTAEQKKKFVLHIDESIIDSPSSSASNSQHNNTGGIYFANYQRNNAQQQNNTPKSQNRAGSAAKSSQKSGQSGSKKKGKRKKAIGGKAAIVFFAFIVLSTAALSYLGLSCVGDMLAINRSEENVEVEIKPDSNYKDIINILSDKKLIKQKQFCYLFTQYRGYDDATFLSGNYYLNSKMGIEGMLRELMEAPVSAETVTLSFPEGYTTSEIFEKLAKYDVGDPNKLYSAVKSETYNKYKFIGDIADDESRYLKLDGYLFPDTYDFYVGADANYILKKFLDNFETKWEDEYDTRAKKLGYTRDEIIIIASIIQKEAANNEEMRVVSSVIHNRLNNPLSYATLDCLSTKDYIQNFVMPVVGEAKGAYYLNEYSTSANGGLPPGPICNPGMDAIKAALYPDETDYFYFCHDDARKIYLAKTYDEHKINLNKMELANVKLAQQNG